MRHTLLSVLGLAALLAICATPASAHNLNSAVITSDCCNYTITYTTTDGSLTPNGTETLSCTFTLTTASGNTSGPFNCPVINTTADDNGNMSATAGPLPLPGGCMAEDFTLSGSATLVDDTTGDTSTIPISFTLSKSCSQGTGKTFTIGPSSMEGDLHISPGDWISGGYNFKFTDNHHGATSYSVTATVTVPVSCPDGTVENVVIPLGAPGQLDGGGVTTFTYDIPAGDTSNHATNDQNSILAWEGAVQAPANLCGGVAGRNQTGAVFVANVAQNPHVGLVDWQFHYRDPNAKGKGNVDCTDASNPKRNDAATCGASWSQTVRDP